MTERLNGLAQKPSSSSYFWTQRNPLAPSLGTSGDGVLLEVGSGGQFHNICGSLFALGFCHLDLYDLADILFLDFASVLCDLPLGLLHIEALKLTEEPTLDGGISNLGINHVLDGFLLDFVTDHCDVVGHQLGVQSGVGLLLLNLLGGSDRGQSVVGMAVHGIHQSLILCLGGVSSHLEVELGTDDLLAYVVKGEVGSGLDGGGGESSVSHNVVLSGSLAIQKLFLGLWGLCFVLVSLTLYGHIIP